MFKKKSLMIQASSSDVLHKIKQQLRFLPLHGYCRENSFKLYRSVAYKHNVGMFQFCIYGTVLACSDHSVVEYKIRPSWSCFLSVGILLLGFFSWLFGCLMYEINVLLPLLWCLIMLAYFIILFSQRNTCIDRFEHILMEP